jgi:hypothetical protein
MIFYTKSGKYVLNLERAAEGGLAGRVTVILEFGFWTLHFIISKNEGLYGAGWTPLSDSRGISKSGLGIYEGIYGGKRRNLSAPKGIYGRRSGVTP